MTQRKRAQVACILCRNSIVFPEYVGQDYSGDLLCSRCGSLLHIKLSRWQVEQYKVLKDRFEEWKRIEKLRELQEAGARALANPEKSNKAGGEEWDCGDTIT